MKKARVALATAASLLVCAIPAGAAPTAIPATYGTGSHGDAHDHARNSAFSLTAWVRPAPHQVAVRVPLISKESARGGYSMAIGPAGREGEPGPRLTFRRRAARGADVVTAARRLVPDRWTHVAVTYDGRLLKLYVDGRHERSARSTRALPNTAAALRVGGRNGGRARFRGQLDDIAIHPRALGSAAIEQLSATWAGRRVNPTPTPTPTPTSSGKAVTRAASSPVLADADAAARVRRSPWEPRPQNTTANHRMPTSDELASFRAASNNQTPYAPLVSGHFTGTTDELIQWTAHKWGFDEDVLRAQAVQESTWYQSAAGDGGISFGLMQIKSTVWRGTAPLTQVSTGFNVDMHGAILRQCYDGKATWLGNGYGAGDLWGCLGYYYSGRWNDAGGIAYVESVKRHLSARAWEQPGF